MRKILNTLVNNFEYILAAVVISTWFASCCCWVLWLCGVTLPAVR